MEPCAVCPVSLPGARQIAAGAAVSTEMVKSYVAAFASVGCDELIFIPTSSSPDQIALLATAVL